MYVVFWIDSMCEPDCEYTSDLNEAIKSCEDHRRVGHSFVTMAIEDSNHVGKMGVSEVDADYCWSKRRDSISVRKNNK